jgi:predicted enzyme related to lactoylglutathione lyase
MSIGHISQIHVTTPDLAEAIAFYRDVLGLNLLFEVPDQQLAFFDVDGTRLYLGSAESDEFRSAPLLYFETDDIDAEYDRLVSAGVETVNEPHVVHSTDEYDLWMSFFKTPAGHTNALTEHRSR